jgi:hypothetical protein
LPDELVSQTHFTGRACWFVFLSALRSDSAGGATFETVLIRSDASSEAILDLASGRVSFDFNICALFIAKMAHFS